MRNDTSRAALAAVLLALFLIAGCSEGLPVAPVSGTITIYNDDDEAVLVAAGTACAVGSGYCQYNLTDTDEAGRYVAYMTVVISTAATQTETFIFTILEKAA